MENKIKILAVDDDPYMRELFNAALGGAYQEGKQHELLSDREFQIFEMFVSGMQIINIAKELSLSAKTVSTHKARILQKMGMFGTVELVSYSIRNDLFS